MADVRLILKLPERVHVRMEELQAMSAADSSTEVVRRSLATYDVLLTATRQRGAKLFLREQDGVERVLEIP